MGDIVFELFRRVVAAFVGGLENGMGATNFGRFVLIGGRAFIVSRGMAVLETFLVGEDEVM